ncbi:hypothetical protein L1987_25991 [Smallanthus sonchifolius]|uniref:Uncharacterized protein n=1 Tax=Smallanthus sonchifolius TaxID=185202 RepID=A0ACB9I888_9ASTR|nr:hypothetical protein L1987_25991 [Smallanthus sonchifolius]
MQNQPTGRRKGYRRDPRRIRRPAGTDANEQKTEPPMKLKLCRTLLSKQHLISIIEKAKRRQQLLSRAGFDDGVKSIDDKQEIAGGGGNYVLKLLSGSFNCSFCMQLPERPVTVLVTHIAQAHYLPLGA